MIPNIFTTIIIFSLFTLQFSAQDSESVHKFDYDRETPLDVRETDVVQRGEISVHDISYVSPKGGRVPAYLVVPSGNGPFAAVIWGHWYWQNSEMRNRNQFLEEAVILAQSGVISLLTDGPVARADFEEDRTTLGEKRFTDLVQQVVDMQRAADLLFARKDVDRARLAYVGHSYNATIGAILRGIDPRFQSFVLMAGTLSTEVDLKSPEYQKYREKVGATKFDDFMTAHAWADSGKYVSRASKAPVLLQYATRENFLTPDRAREYLAIVSEPKKFKLYEAPHALNAYARRDRIAFLCKQLKLESPPPRQIDSIPDLVQPPMP